MAPQRLHETADRASAGKYRDPLLHGGPAEPFHRVVVQEIREQDEQLCPPWESCTALVGGIPARDVREYFYPVPAQRLRNVAETVCPTKVACIV